MQRLRSIAFSPIRIGTPLQGDIKVAGNSVANSRVINAVDCRAHRAYVLDGMVCGEFIDI